MIMRLSNEYTQHIRSDKWRNTSRFCRRVWCDRDCIFPLFPSHETDHISYKNMGHEWPIRDVLPLSRTNHQIITYLRKLLKGGGMKITLAQRLLAWVMRIFAMLWLPFIWALWAIAKVVRFLLK